MTIFKWKNIASSRANLDSNVFIPLFLILTMIALITSLQAYSSIHTGATSLPILFRLLLSKLVYSWYFSLLALIVQWHSRRIQLTKKTLVRWFLIHLTTLVISFFIHETVSLGADVLIWGTKQNATVLYLLFNNPSVWIETLVYILFLLSFSLMEYRRMSQENEIRCSQLEVQLIRSKLKEIRSKIQPPFLFSSLQSILELVRTHKNKDANHILTLLSDFLRKIVYDAEREEVTLDEELRFLNQYLEIEEGRSRWVFTVSQQMDVGILHAVVPNFILQPIVEELVYKNTQQDSLKNEIIIRAVKKGGHLEIEIEHQFAGNHDHPVEMETKSIVLDITKERLSQLYGNDQALTIQFTPDREVHVKIRIPFREKNIESEGIFIAEGVA